MESLLNNFPVVIEIPVAWGEMDAFQHVNNTVYFRYFEDVRIAYFDKLKFMESMQKTGVGPILSHIQCRFRAPVTFPDTLSVGTKITQIEEDRFIMSYRIVSHKLQKLVADGDSIIVVYDYQQQKKAAIPEEILKKILLLEDGKEVES
ncbi:MAG: acyl-CoA thioesterase [SAR324 cluster bacterium]|nr:acyl-CoA thioesterase [SAR324 cluster bacterium]